MANAAALNGKAFAYLVWGAEDRTHAIVGTSFFPSAAKKGNEPLETWLLRLLTLKIHFRFFELNLEGRSVVLLEIGRAFRHPVRFQNEPFTRVGQVKKPLKDVPDRERELWRIFDQTPFEDLVAVERPPPTRCCGCWTTRPTSICWSSRYTPTVTASWRLWPMTA